MNPPFVFIFTSRPIPENTLAQDRWKSFQITENFKMAEFTVKESV